MTRPEILALEAGPALDAFLAELAMGWQVEVAIPTSYRVPLWIDGQVTRRSEPFHWQPWVPSEQIAPAFDLVGSDVFSLFFNGLVWRAVFGVTGTFAAEAPTAPLAICRAKLLSVLPAS